MKTLSCILALLLSGLPGSLLHAQTSGTPADEPLSYQVLVHRIATSPATTDAERTARERKINDLLALESHMRLFLEYAAQSNPVAVHDVIADLVENSRIDEQFSAGPNAAGSASAVAKAGVTSLLSLAMEYGAITQALNGNSATISGNADGVLRFLAGAEPFPYCPIGKDSCGTPVLKDLGFTVSFDVGQGSLDTFATGGGANPPGTPSTIDLISGKTRFSGASAKYVFKNPRDIRSKEFQKLWSDYYNTNREKFQAAGEDLLVVLEKTLAPLLSSDAYEATQLQYKPKLVAAAGNEAALQDAVNNYLNQQLKNANAVAPKFNGEVRSALGAYMRYTSTVRPLLEAINKEPVLSAEYNYSRPIGQPDLHHFRVMSTLNPFGPNGTLSINVAASLYNSSSVRSQFGNWRDAQASLQLERRLTDDLANYPARFSLAGYFQYMVSPGLISLDSGNLAPGTNIPLAQDAAIALAPTGPIWIGEAKLTLKLKGSGAELPISVTHASRTDLVKSSVTRGHIGLTFDFDKLFAGGK